MLDESFEVLGGAPTSESLFDFVNEGDVFGLQDIEWCNAPSTKLDDSYRGMAMMMDFDLHTTQTSPFDRYMTSHAKSTVSIPQKSKKVPISEPFRIAVEVPSSSSLKTDRESTKSSPCRSVPLSLLKTHVKLSVPTCSSFEALCDALQQVLQDCAEFDFIFDESAMQWRGKYLCGKKRCLAVANLYYDADRKEGFVAELVKTKGDAKVFQELFRQFDAALSTSAFRDHSQNSVVLPAAKKNMSFAPLSLTSSISIEDLIAQLLSIEQMVRGEFLDSRLTAAMMLCDLASIDSSLLSEDVIVEKILQIVEALALSGGDKDTFSLFEGEEEEIVAEIVEQALIALSLFCAATPVFQETLLRPPYRDTLRMVALLVCDAPSAETAFLTAQLRRECALLMLSLAQYNAAVCVEQLRDSLSQSVQDWVLTLSELQDAKLRDHGVILQTKLIAVM